MFYCMFYFTCDLVASLVLLSHSLIAGNIRALKSYSNLPLV